MDYRIGCVIAMPLLVLAIVLRRGCHRGPDCKLQWYRLPRHRVDLRGCRIPDLGPVLVHRQDH